MTMAIGDLRKGLAPSVLAYDAVTKIRRVKASGREVSKLSDGVFQYFAKYGDPATSWNCKFLNERGEKIACAAFAHIAMIHGFKKLYKIFKDGNTIRKNPDLMKYSYRKELISREGKEYFGFGLDQFGEVLKTLIKSVREVKFNLISELHAMSGSIEWKEKKGYVVIKFYDPNKTITYQRCLCFGLGKVNQLSIRHFLSKEDLSTYFPKFPYAILVTMQQREAEYSEIKLQEGYLDAQMYYSLRMGFLPKIAELFNRIKKEKIRMDVLKAVDNLGYSGFVYAISENHIQTVEFFMNLIFDSDLNSGEIFELIGETQDLSASPMFYAFKEGYAEIVGIFAKLVLKSKLELSQKVTLLEALSVNGIPGLFIALRKGNTQTVNVFVKLILDSKLEPYEIFTILKAVDSEGIPGLFIAFEEGNIETIEAFARLILNSKLESREKVDLLEAIGTYGTPGLFMLLQEGKTQAVKRFVKLILYSNLHPQEKVRILRALRSDGRPGFSIALLVEKYETAEAYMSQILNAENFSGDQKVSLLEAVWDDGSGLSFPREKGHLAITRRFDQLIQESRLSIEHKHRLFRLLLPIAVPIAGPLVPIY